MELKKPTDLYYIQDSREYVGNCVVFWGKNNSGYVCDITKAGLYTYEEAMSQHKSRHTDIPWLKEDVENALRTFCDVQYLSQRQHEVYDEIQELKNKRAIENKAREESINASQLKDDLFYTMEILSNNISYPLSKEYIIDSISKYVQQSQYFDLYHTPIIYTMTVYEIFDSLVENKYLFECEKCGQYQDYLENNLCYYCNEELEEEQENDNK